MLVKTVALAIKADPTDPQHPSLCPTAGASFTGRVTGPVAGGLRQRHAIGCSSLCHQQTAVCVECRCSSCVLVAEVRFRDITSARAALAEGGAAD